VQAGEIMVHYGERLPDSRFVVLPRSGHGFMWEIPAQFNAAVLEFLGA